MQTIGDEYEEPVHTSSAPRSRKISSISEIVDSSIMFLNKYEWAEVEANEPSANDIDFQSLRSSYEDNGYQYTNFYLSNFNQLSVEKEHTSNSNLDRDGDHSLFDLPKDILFDIKSKFLIVANLSINKLSQVLISTPIYQKYLSPFVRMNNCSNHPIQSPFCESSTSAILQKIKKLKIISRNPFMSPLLAPDEYLKQMPPVYFVVSFLYTCPLFAFYD